VSYRSTGLYQAGGTDGPFVVKAHDEYALTLVTGILESARSLPGHAVSELVGQVHARLRLRTKLLFSFVLLTTGLTSAILLEALLNLTVNASDAMLLGGKLTIETQNVIVDAVYAQARPSVAPGSYVMIGVSDTGHGMDEATKGESSSRFLPPQNPAEERGWGWQRFTEL
jgi:signal transduction histidine kinase